MPQSRWTTEERLEVGLAMVRGQKPVSQMCRLTEAGRGLRYGVSETAVYRWRDQFLQGARAGLSGGRGDEVEQLRAENEQLKTIIGELTVANRIPSEGAAALRRLSPAAMELIEEELGRAPQGARVKQVLAQLSVSKATFYRRRGKRGAVDSGPGQGPHQSRPRRARDRADPPWLVERIRDLVSDPYTRVYGYRKVHAVLDREGVEVSEKVVRSIMRHNGWQRPRKRRGGEWV